MYIYIYIHMCIYIYTYTYMSNIEHMKIRSLRLFHVGLPNQLSLVLMSPKHLRKGKQQASSEMNVQGVEAENVASLQLIRLSMTSKVCKIVAANP